MARRLLCCPHTNDTGDIVWKYLYVDTSKLLVKDVTKELCVLEEGLEKSCCFDTLEEYIQGKKSFSDSQKQALSFNLLELNSFELFESVNELKLKTGSEKILFSCLLSYYRREYDGSQQYAFFSNPTVSNLFVSSHDGVEHEMTLETREFISTEDETVELETLDKGKSEAERKAEEEAAQAQAEFEEAMAKADKEAAKKEKHKARKKAREIAAEEERYRELRNRDDVNSEEYRNLRQHEEEMRQNNDILATEYTQDNYASLPGYVPADIFANEFEKVTNESIIVPIDDKSLYNFASKLDEFGVPYTVVGTTLNDGTHISEVSYTSEYASSGLQALEFYELERQLAIEGIINPSSYYSAFQLSAMDYACVNHVDTSFISSGDFNSRQMYRIVEAGLNGQDMSVLSNPAYSPAQMDALSYFMHNGWDTSAISSPSLGLDAVAGEILREEVSHGTPKDISFFESHDYNSFLSYDTNNGLADYSNNYDGSYRKEQAAKELARQNDKKEQLQEFKDNLHDSYIAVQQERNYISDNAGQIGGQPQTSLTDDYTSADSLCNIGTVDTGLHSSVGSSAQISKNGNAGSPINQQGTPVSQRGVSTVVAGGAVAPNGVNKSQTHLPGVNTSVSRGAVSTNGGSNGNGSSSGGKPGVLGSNGNSNLSGIHRHGNNSSGSPVPYNFNSGYTPTGRTNNKGAYVPNSAVGRKNSGGPQYSASAGGGSRPNPGPGGNNGSGGRHYPLNDLKVRSHFARTAGLKVVNGGSQALSMSGRFFRSSVRQSLMKVARNDETGTFSAYNTLTRGVGTTLYTAKLIADVPRVFGRLGQGISYSSNIVANVGRWAVGKDSAKKTFQPMTLRTSTKELKRVQEQHFNTIKKRFGKNAAKMNIREINSNINKLTKNKALADGKKLIEENRKLNKEISLLEKKKAKGKWSVKDNTTLAAKYSLKSKNERKIKSIAKNHPEFRKLSELMKLKQLKEKQAKEITELGRKRKKFGKKDARWKQLPGRFFQSFVSQLYKAGDDVTTSGIASASNFAMSFARNPLARLVGRGTVSFIVKPTVQGAKFVATKAAQKFIVPTTRYQKFLVKKKTVKNTMLSRKARNKKVRRNAAQKTKTALKKRVIKTVGSNRVTTIKTVVGNGKNKLSAVNRARKKVAQVLSAPFKALQALGKALSAAKAWLLKAALCIGAVVLVLVLVISSVSVCFQGVTSFLLAGEMSSDGRIDLEHYVNVINKKQESLQDEISDIASKKKANGKPFDNIFYDYNGLPDNNTKQILSMAYVRFDYDWGKIESTQANRNTAVVQRNNATKKYMKQLYDDSNYVDYGVSDPYECSNGCEERNYKCYDALDKFVTETRKSKYNVSDHSKEDGVIKDNAKGCKKASSEQFYHCTDDIKYFKAYTKKHLELYNAYNSRGGCKSKTEWKTKITFCSGCTFTVGANGVPVYSCPGHEERYSVTVYECPGHKETIHSYSCPGHKETICRGEHQDLTITVTTLGFDEIFAADSSVAASGTNLRGEAYNGTFTISAYCGCHDCCHVTVSGTLRCGKKGSAKCKEMLQNVETASGTKAKNNHTLAVDTSQFNMWKGKHVWIDGKEYVVEDSGALAQKGRDFDMFFSSHQEALNWGVRNKTVYKNITVASDTLSGDEYGFTGWTKDNIEICKNVYSSLTAEKANEDYKGLDKITSISYGSGGSIDFDFSGIIFDDKTGLTNLQKELLKVIERNNIPAKKGYCQAWVSNVYAAATGIDQSRCCAIHAGVAWGVSNDWANIQVGSAVYGYNGGGNVYGHVGIYIGDGKVAHNIGYVKIDTLEYWVKRYDGRCWGWNGGQNLTGNKEYNVTKPGIYMSGRH